MGFVPSWKSGKPNPPLRRLMFSRRSLPPRHQPPPSGPKPCSCSLPSSPGSGKPPKSGWKASSDRKRLFQALDECRTELENRRDQNQCLEAENKALSLRLSEQMWQNISLDREITHMRTMNENLKAKLDAALAQQAKHTTQAAGDLFLWDFED